MLKRIKKVFEVVDLGHKIADAIVWLAGMVIPNFVIASSTLRFWTIGGGILGGGIGFYVSTSWWGGKGESRCKRAAIIFGILTLVALGTFTFLLMVLKPEFAALYQSFASIREVLLRSEFLPNLLGFLLCGATIWFFVSFITLLSRRLWTASPNT